jgi:iron complex outermembrane receptor protein
LEYRKELIRGDWVRRGVESKSNLDGFSRDQAGLYLEHKIKIGSIIDMTPGLYMNWYSDFGWNIFPGVDLGYSIKKKWRIYANAGKSYRVPTFYDQYYKSPVERGNKNLKPEQAWTYEAGVRFENRGLFAEANIFYRKSEDLIDWIYSKADSIWKAQNILEGRALGVELAVAVDFKALTGKDLLLERLTFSYNYIDNRLYGIKALQSRYALDNIRNQLIAGLDHRIFRKLKNSLKFRFIDRIDQHPYLLIDDRLYWEHNDCFMIFFEATNLTNQSYTEVMTPMPGRWIRAGIRWEISY